MSKLIKFAGDMLFGTICILAVFMISFAITSIIFKLGWLN